MRNTLVAAAFAFLGASIVAQVPAKIAQIPDGKVEGNIYTNAALGVSYEIPNGWTAKADPQMPMAMDPRKPDSKANLCTKVLLHLTQPNPVPGRFFAWAYVLAIDPECFGSPAFPTTLDKKQINKVVDKMLKPFSNASFFSPYGVTLIGNPTSGKVWIDLTGGMTINALEGHPASTKEPLGVHTLFSFTEWNGLWIAWAYVADEHSETQLELTSVKLKAPQ